MKGDIKFEILLTWEIAKEVIGEIWCTKQERKEHAIEGQRPTNSIGEKMLHGVHTSETAVLISALVDNNRPTRHCLQFTHEKTKLEI